MPVELRRALWTAAGNLRCWPRAREFSLKTIWPKHPWRDAGFGEEVIKSPEMKARLLVKTPSRSLLRTIHSGSGSVMVSGNELLSVCTRTYPLFGYVGPC